MITVLLAATVAQSVLPEIKSVYAVAPDMLGIEIQAGWVVPSSLSPYKPLPGDQKEVHAYNGVVRQVGLKRNGAEMGWLIGPKRDQLVTFEQFRGEILKIDLADTPRTYRLSSSEDPTWKTPQEPVAVYRKSKPNDWVQPSWEFTMTHRIYLRLHRPLTKGKRYDLSFTGLNVQTPSLAYRYDPDRQASEAVHVSQIGYRPNDPLKCAYLSVWLGTGGAYSYPKGLGFRVVDSKSQKAVISGKVLLAKDASEPDRMFETKNYSQTSVYKMDFSALKRPGTYRVAVDGVGLSMPFMIGEDPWQKAFKIQMKGLYNQRSGVALGPPYTSFVKPRDMHPADGQKVWQTTWSVLDKAEAFAELESHKTNEVVPGAWGGYHDAGDWNPRRVTHLRVTMAHLELQDLFPKYFEKLSWKIPAATYTKNGLEIATYPLPDSLKEAVWGLEVFRRLQKADGSMPCGIESNSDPIDGEVSWLQSTPLYLYAPDLWSSYVYAAAAARLSRLLKPFDPALSRIYLDSTLKAMRWAEADWAKRDRSLLKSVVTDDRNLAAIELYRLTSDRRWNQVFLENTVLKDPKARLFIYEVNNQRDAAFAYTRLPLPMADATLRQNAIDAILRDADGAIEYGKGNGFGIVQTDPERPLIMGFFSIPDAVQVCRAHFLTHDVKYLAGAVQACQFAGGANPSNMTYTTGVGTNWPKNPLLLDSRRTGQPAPIGLTIYGNLDSKHYENQDWVVWPVKRHLVKVCTPSPWDWPAPEAYWDIFIDPVVNEFTVDFWAPNVYVWGYLAARR